MQQYKYLYTKRTAAKIRSFYKNVAKKYRHTYSYEDMERNVRDAPGGFVLSVWFHSKQPPKKIWNVPGTQNSLR